MPGGKRNNFFAQKKIMLQRTKQYIKIILQRTWSSKNTNSYSHEKYNELRSKFRNGFACKTLSAAGAFNTVVGGPVGVNELFPSGVDLDF